MVMRTLPLSLLLLTACSTSHGGALDAASTTDAALPSDAGPPPTPTRCETTCDARRTDIGGCPVEDCEARCAETTDRSFDAFATCVISDPLCFQTLDDCVHGALYPAPVPTPVTFRGSDLLAHEGRTAHLLFRADFAIERATAEIRDGAFEVTLTPEVPGYGVITALAYVDVDGDEVCTAGVDRTAYLMPERSGTFDAPAWTVTLRGPVEASVEGHCGEL